MADIRMQLLNSCMESISGGNQMNPVNSLAPAVPCHLLTHFVATLNSQLSLLLPKLNERDIEREKLRKENQRLREQLNSMHERERVSSERTVRGRLPILARSSTSSSSKTKRSSSPNIFTTTGSRSSKLNTMDPNSPKVQEYLYDAMRKSFR